MAYELKLLTGNANRPLAEEIAQYLHVPMADAEVTRFSDGEVYVQVDENVRGADVFVIQPTCPPVNDSLMELLIMVDAMKRASARRITAVLPYYGYARQDRKVQSRVPISARIVADLLEAAGIHRVLALDLNAGQIQGYFSVPVDHLFAGPVVMIDYLRKKHLRDPVIVAPDAGGVERARAMAKRFDAGLAHHRALGRVAPGGGDPTHLRRGLRLDIVRVSRLARSFSHGDARADDQAARRERQGVRQATLLRGRRSRGPLRRKESRVGHGRPQGGAPDDPRPRGHDPATHPAVRR